MNQTEEQQSESKPAGIPRGLVWIGGGTFFVLFAAWMSTCFVFVDETEVVVLERLGTVVAVLDRADDRGLNVKLPWPVGNARRFDRRTQLFDPPGREVFTRDRKNVTVDAYVCWKIAASVDGAELRDRPTTRFFRSLGTLENAQARLETRVRSALATRIASVQIGDLLAVEEPEKGLPDNGTEMSLSVLSDQLLDDVRQRPDEEASVLDRLGIDVVDVRIKRINFPRGNQQAVFERMKSERQKIADRYRSAGDAQNTVIRSQADRQYSEIISRADAEAERIRGKAEAEALRLLNEAHARDPEFYQTIKTLDAYRKIINEKTTLVLSASSSLLKLLVDGLPETLSESGHSEGNDANINGSSESSSTDASVSKGNGSSDKGDPAAKGDSGSATKSGNDQ